jgi:hypothetical protein
MSHVFTEAGLGQAPFKVVGFTEKSTGCAFCGRAIQKVCIVKSADGIRSNIGCDCVKKTGDKGLIAGEKVAISNFKRAAKVKIQMDKYFDVMVAKWGEHEYLDPTIDKSDKEAFLKDMERLMKEVVNESNQY